MCKRQDKIRKAAKMGLVPAWWPAFIVKSYPYEGDKVKRHEVTSVMIDAVCYNRLTETMPDSERWELHALIRMDEE